MQNAAIDNAFYLLKPKYYALVVITLLVFINLAASKAIPKRCI